MERLEEDPEDDEYSEEELEDELDEDIDVEDELELLSVISPLTTCRVSKAKIDNNLITLTLVNFIF